MFKQNFPPGPRGHFLFGHLAEFRTGLLEFISDLSRQYGEVASFRLGPKRCVLVNHPDLIEDVLVTQARNFRKHFVLRMNPILLGKGLLTNDGDSWLRQRRLAQPAFHRQKIAAYGTTMVEYAERLQATWNDGDVRDLHTDMMKLALEIVSKTLFGADGSNDASEVDQALKIALHYFSNQFKSLIRLPGFVPTPANLRVRRAVKRLDAILYRFIARRRHEGLDRGDLLSMLLNARDEDDGGQMTDKQVRDECMTLFLAGHETTAIALAWTFFLIAQHPEVEKRLVDELRAVLGDRAPQVADLPQLRYTEWTVMESMRLYPPAYMFGREPLAPVKIGTYDVPRGTTVFFSPWVTHHDPRFFALPEKFDPERWSEGGAQSIPKYAYFPFGGGPRVCIGNTFAMMEASLILATLLRRWRFTLVPEHPVMPLPLMTLRPAVGIKVRCVKQTAEK